MNKSEHQLNAVGLIGYLLLAHTSIIIIMYNMVKIEFHLPFTNEWLPIRIPPNMAP